MPSPTEGRVSPEVSPAKRLARCKAEVDRGRAAKARGKAKRKAEPEATSAVPRRDGARRWPVAVPGRGCAPPPAGGAPPAGPPG